MAGPFPYHSNVNKKTQIYKAEVKLCPGIEPD